MNNQTKPNQNVSVAETRSTVCANGPNIAI